MQEELANFSSVRLDSDFVKLEKIKFKSSLITVVHFHANIYINILTTIVNFL